MYDNIQAQILISIIVNTIQCAYLAAVDGLFKSNLDCKYLRIPQFEILKSVIMMYITLGPILNSKALISGNYRVLKTIFLEQLHFNCNKDFKDYLFLVYSDQKTAKYICTYKQERTESESAYDSYRWVLPVLGLWYLRLNFLYIIIRTFFSNKKHTQ